MSPSTDYQFSFGPWNINEGNDPFGPDIRPAFPHEEKFALYRPLGFTGVQLHDDDVVPGLESLNAPQILQRAELFGTMLKNQGLTPEFVAPRLWFAPETIDGAITSNNPAERAWARARLQQCVDIARAVGSKAIVLWLAREGTYIREAKDAAQAYEAILESVNAVLDYDPTIEIWIEPKPNEPADLAYVPTAGHGVALALASHDAARVKIIIESAHSILAGLDPSDEMAFCISHGKLGSVHLNDQNGLKYDQDKNFGSVNLRAAFNQVLVLERGGYGRAGEFIGLDVKAMRTQASAIPVTQHLQTSREVFLMLVDKARSYDLERVNRLRADRDYEGLESYTLRHLLGVE